MVSIRPSVHFMNLRFMVCLCKKWYQKIVYLKIAQKDEKGISPFVDRVYVDHQQKAIQGFCEKGSNCKS
jgi:hypothetical protein